MMQSFASTYLAADAGSGQSAAQSPTYPIETRHFIDGEFQPSRSKMTFPLISPTTGRLSADVSAAQAEDVDLAVEAASRASKSWGKVSGTQVTSAMLSTASDPHAI